MNTNGNQMKCRIWAFGAALAVQGLSLQAAIVNQTTGDGFGQSSFIDSARWSDLAAPSPGNDYVTAVLLRTPSAGGSYVFGGDSLTLDPGGTMLLKGPAGTLTFTDLILNGGSISNGDQSGYVLAGNIAVTADSRFYSNDGNRTTTVLGPISGSAQLEVGNGDTSGGGNTTTYIFAGDNSAFSGDFRLHNTSSSASYPSVTRFNNANASGTGSLLIDGPNISIGNSSGGSITLAGNNAQVWNNNFRFLGPDDLNLGTGAVSLGTATGSSRSVDVTNSGDTLTVGGVISNGTTANALVKRGAGSLVLNGNNTFTGGVTVQQGGILSIPTIANTGVAQPLGQGTATVVLDGSGGTASVLQYTGGTASNNRNFALAGTINAGGVFEVTSGAANLTLSGNITGASAGFSKSGPGTLTLSGSGDWSGNTFVTAGTLHLNGGSINNTGNVDLSAGTTFRVNTSGQVRGDNINVADGSTLILEGGTLRTNTLNLNSTGIFDWGAGTISMRQYNTGNAGSIDRTYVGGAVSGPSVFEGTIIDASGSLTSSAGSGVDLGQLYINGGLRYDQLSVSGTLDLSAADDTLNLAFNPYLLRPNSPGSLIIE
ncbi:MAG: autotransporter-associated beta strand repeat-containing protein [Parvularculaceae bacterium]